ncbi:MAG TPA: hypothetical protein VEY88_20740 [Archangium sp.]|nr:hypothetical protein [Myxococcaceae bacterium]HZH78469.1 hypothetical protein [Archangium sp.]
MVTGNPRRLSEYTSRPPVAYALAYVLAVGAVVLGFVLQSVPWLALGIWLGASLTVLLMERALLARAPHEEPEEPERFGAMFRGSPAALTVIGLMAVAALVVSFFAHW